MRHDILNKCWDAANDIEMRLAEDAEARAILGRLDGRDRDRALIAMAITTFVDSHTREEFI